MVIFITEMSYEYENCTNEIMFAIVMTLYVLGYVVLMNLKSCFSSCCTILLSKWGISLFQLYRLRSLQWQLTLKCISMEHVAVWLCVFVCVRVRVCVNQ